MPYEVEMKFPLADSAELESRLAELEATVHPTIEQIDTYYNHPARDFAETDEALRVRTVNGQYVVTYKGPLVDPVTKTRHEIEIPVGDETVSGEQMKLVLENLGFTKVRDVRKTRKPFTVSWKDVPFEIVLDDVAELGTFAEIETTADSDNREAATQAIQDFARELGLENSERRSYLAMLLERDAAM
ncbi:MAG: class IV adenylate cyclase [Planctomycetaceae bacterium]